MSFLGGTPVTHPRSLPRGYPRTGCSTPWPGQDGLPSGQDRGGTPTRTGWVPSWPGQNGVPPQEQDVYPLARTGWGTPPTPFHQDRKGYPQTGYAWTSYAACGYASYGFLQEDFLASNAFMVVHFLHNSSCMNMECGY